MQHQLTDAVLRRILHDAIDRLNELDLESAEEIQKADLELQRAERMEGLAAKILDIEKIKLQTTMAKIKADKYYRSSDGNGRIHIHSDFFEEHNTKQLT